MDEPNVRTVDPELLYDLVSLVFDAPYVQLVSLTVDAFQPLVHLEDRAKHRLGAVLQPEQLGVGYAQHAPIQLDLAWPQALSFCCEDFVDFTAGLLVGRLLVGIYFLGHRSTLLPSGLVSLAG